ncbi:MAG: DNA-directed RNA polymerase subunit beta' [Clostridia bacterium]|nr:DNA-directed RNA polymerase subunit beta' [Clostridia bacterium]
MIDFNNFDSIQISLASPETILKWSHGEVKKPETINYRTLKPEKDGLFCEKIFGPTKDGECHCGKYKKNRYRGIVCDKCGVEVTSSKVRRTRMGHIELAAPVSHIWFFRGIPSRMGLILDMPPRSLEKVLYFAAYIVTDPGTTALEYKQVLSEREYRDAITEYGYQAFTAQMGAEAIQKLLAEVDLETLAAELREEVDHLTEVEKEKGGQTISQKKMRLIKRLEVVEAFRQSHNKPEWMVLSVIPVIPPDLRPMVQLEGGRFATSDLNDLYRRVINRNNRLKRLKELRAPDIIVRNEKRMLQEAVDALLDNGRRGRPVTGPNTRPLKSLSDMLRGKQGRFRQNLLGKRVDYSGRSVIVVGPELKIYQCGLPKEMALELFKPFVMRKLVNDGKALNVKSARKMVDRVRPEVWDILEEIIKEHPVLLNRAPTLHRLGIQAFEPVLVEGRALRLHPLVCTAYNADFDGDQMAVHVPLSAEAQAEARVLMLSANNLLAPKDGKPITVPTQDMVLGSYYLTLNKNKDFTNAPVFSSYDEAKMAYDIGEIDLHTAIIVRRFGEFEGEPISQRINTTIGKLIFNEAIPQDLGFVDRSKRENALLLEIDKLVKKGTLGEILDKCIKVHGLTETAVVLDKIKSLGYKFSTKGAITVGIEDIIVPPEKQQLIEETDKLVDKIVKQYRRGLITEEERYNNVIKAWTDTIDKLTGILKKNMGEYNPINMMSDSGARGNINQIKQLAGMRGLMTDTSGKSIEIPIKANFREGLDVLEFFISSHGTRKTLSDTALRTADSGYLTRRLVDVSQEVIIREHDCGTEDYIEISAIENQDAKEQGPIVPLAARISGRYPAETIVDPATGEVLADRDTLITEEIADKIVAAGHTTVKIRSVLTCKCKYGVCAKCYGSNLATNEECNVGDAVGIIAAQSIGEPGTQLTMRTFHTGGVATADDITQGLPRVEELFEARKPKGNATISELDGTVSINDSGKKREVTITSDDGAAATYSFVMGTNLRVQDGDVVKKGDMLVGGSINPHDIIRVVGVTGVQNYIIEEVQKVYNMQGVKINDRHIEVIVRQMLRKVKVDDAGGTSLLPGSMVDITTFNAENEKAVAEGKPEATGTRTLLGITKASLATESFLSAASFQETTRVLTEAAIKSKRDPLLGLKENVIIGKLIPAGTGMSRYKDIEIEVEALKRRPGEVLTGESFDEEELVETEIEDVEAEELAEEQYDVVDGDVPYLDDSDDPDEE